MISYRIRDYVQNYFGRTRSQTRQRFRLAQNISLGIGLVVRRLVATLDEVTGNHLVVAQARADHRVDAGVGVDDDLKKCRALELHECLDRACDVFRFVELFANLKAVGFGSLDEILAMQRLVAAGHAAVVIELLPLPHHAVAIVVQYDDFDR